MYSLKQFSSTLHRHDHRYLHLEPQQSHQYSIPKPSDHNEVTVIEDILQAFCILLYFKKKNLVFSWIFF